ncbi:MAG: hypothetical protein QM754_06900 [Tepidisphaeraceae bacterium]
MKASLNVFQKTQRLWDTIHPYNAAQAMELAGDFLPERVSASFHAALEDLGLGEFVLRDGRYFIQPPMHPPAVNTDAASFEDHLSAEMNRPFPRDLSVPFRPFDFWDGDRHFVGLTYQHWVADSVSIRMLMRRWFERLTGVAEACRPIKLPEGGLLKSFGPAGAGWSVLAQAASLFSLQSRMKKMRRVEAHGRWDVRVMLRRGPDGLISAVRKRARAVGATVGDVFVAAAAEASAKHGPAVRTKRHPGLCMGTIVDLRARNPRPADNTFGLYLGFLMTDFADPEAAGFDGVLRKAVAARKTAAARKSAEASQLNMTLGYLLATRLERRKLLEFYRKRFPVACGLSSVNMTPGWAGEAHPSPLAAYHRISPTGPLLPIVLTPTTLGERLDLCFTYRTALLNAERAEALVTAFIERLKAFAG